MQGCLPASAKPIVDSLRIGMNDLWVADTHALPRITQELKDSAKHCLVRIDQHMQPAEKEGIKAAVVTLLSHFYTADLPEKLYRAIATDWISVLSDYPAWAIEQARIDYLKMTSKKPLPNDIRKLCGKATSKYTALKRQCDHILRQDVEPERGELTEEELKARAARAAQIIAEAKQKMGVVND